MVEPRAVSARRIAGVQPVCESGLLIIEEEPAVLDRRRWLHLCNILYIDGLLRHGRHISPPIPRRYTHLFGNVVDAIDRSSFVRAGNNDGAADALQWVGNQLYSVALPLAPYAVHVDLPGLDERLYQTRLTHRPCNDDGCGGLGIKTGIIRKDSAVNAGYTADIMS
jgi:hypothetical protein